MARSLRVVRLLAVAKSSVTAKAFWSWAAEGSSRVMPFGSASLRASVRVASTSPEATCGASGPFVALFRYSVSEPRYSGVSCTSPFSSAGAITSRVVSSLTSAGCPAFSSTCW